MARAFIAVLLGVISLGVWAAHDPSIAQSDPPSNAFRFVYDEDGRLKAAIDPKGDTATYSWDAAGNLTSIDRTSSSALSVLQLDPGEGSVGGDRRDRRHRILVDSEQQRRQIRRHRSDG